jgi:hypothetical protein
VVGGVHVSGILEHPLCVLEIGDVLFHVGHYFIDVLALRENGHGVFFVEVIFLIGSEVLGPNLERSSFLLGSYSPSPRRKCM